MTLKARFLSFLKYRIERSNLTAPKPALQESKLPHNSVITKDHFAYLGNHLRSQCPKKTKGSLGHRDTEVDPEVKKLHKRKVFNYVYKRYIIMCLFIFLI